MIDKKTFLDIASRLYDEITEEKLFNEYYESPAHEERKIEPYKPLVKSQYVRISNIASHYRVTTGKIEEICNSIGIKRIVYKSNGSIGREDMELLVMVIAKKYNNFND